MKIIYYSLTLALVFINVAGVTLLFSRWLPTYTLARSTGLLILGLVCFFLEHFVGFGQPYGLWLVTTIVSALLLYWHRDRIQSEDFRRTEWVFGIALLYGLAWKWTFPVIYPSSERVTDLYFIGNYLTGATLPPPDHWLPPNRFDFYYGFQHYMAALMGRIFGLAPGLTYNFAFAFLMALSITLAWEFTGCFLRQPWKRWLLILTLVFGGTGATLFVHLGHQNTTETPQSLAIQANDGMWSSARFIGLFDQRLNTKLGQSLFPKNNDPKQEALELPLEDFGYQFFVGDYHPPLGGFFLLLLALTLIGVLETRFKEVTIGHQRKKSPHERCSEISNLQALLALTIPAMIAINTWTFPLQVALVTGWISWRYFSRLTPDWKALVTGGLAGFLLLYPFLAGFTSNAAPTPVKWVTMQEHTPIRQFLAMHWALLLFAGIAIFQKQHRRLGLCFGLVFIGLLFISEMIFIDDPTDGRYQRTNTVMKWWGWIWTGGLLTLGTLLLSSQRRWPQTVAMTTLLIINLYAFNIARYWIYSGKTSAGKLTADSIYTRDATVRDMFQYLAQAPYGVVLENCYGNAYTDSGIYAAFSAKPTVLGWPLHLVTWHGKSSQIWQLKEKIEQFYAGKLSSPVTWLLTHNVQYIIWNAKDGAQANHWENIDKTISGTYRWIPFQPLNQPSVGLWVRQP